MNSPLEQFVRDHREEFDAEEPGQELWEKIRKDLDLPEKKTAPVRRLNRAWWSAAAAVILILAGGIFYTIHTRSGSDQSAAQADKPSNTNGSNTAPTSENPGPANNSLAQNNQSNNQPETPAGNNPAGTTQPRSDNPGKSLIAGTSKPGARSGQTSGSIGEQEELANEEMFHYAKLVEIKHRQLKTIEKDEPLLYRQFSSDVNKLDSVYHLLEKQLPNNPNQEQLLEAMVQNLQLQMGLLNHQLDIIKQINHSKKTAYEKAYKTI